MKNIMIIDNGENCAYDIFQVSDEIFSGIFIYEGQNIEFIEDIERRLSEKEIDEMFKGFWSNPMKKSEVAGIHGILFYGLSKIKKKFYPNKKDSDLDGWARPWISDPSAAQVNTPEFMAKLWE